MDNDPQGYKLSCCAVESMISDEKLDIIIVTKLRK